MENRLTKNEKCLISDFIKIEKKEIAYFLGLLWSDGYIRKNTNSIGIECITEDMNIFISILDRIAIWNRYDRQRKDKQPVTNITLSSEKLHKFLADNDYHEKSIKSPDKIISKIPEYLIKYFLLGIVDGDGCFYFNNEKYLRQFSITGSFNQDWIGFEKIFIKLRIKYSIIRIKTKKTGYSQLRITEASEILKFGNFIYSTFHEEQIGLPRKYIKYEDIVSNYIKDSLIKEEAFKLYSLGKSAKKIMIALNIKRATTYNYIKEFKKII